MKYLFFLHNFFGWNIWNKKPDLLNCLFSQPLCICQFPGDDNSSDPAIIISHENSDQKDICILMIDSYGRINVINYTDKEDITVKPHIVMQLPQEQISSNPQILLCENGFYIFTTGGFIGRYSIKKNVKGNYVINIIWTRNDFLPIISAGLDEKNEKIYIQDGQNTVFCLNHNTGKEIWLEKHAFSSRVINFPHMNIIFSEEKPIVCTTDGIIKVLTTILPHKGERTLFSFPLDIHRDYIINAIFCTSEKNKIIFISNNGQILTLNTSVPNEWKVEHSFFLDSPITCPPCHVEKIIFCNSEGQNIREFYDVVTPFSQKNYPAATEKKDILYLIDNDGNIYKFNPMGKKKLLGSLLELLKIPLNETIQIAGLLWIKNGILMIIDQEGKYYIVDTAGELKIIATGQDKKLSALRKLEMMYIWEGNIIFLTVSNKGWVSLFSLNSNSLSLSS